MLSMDPAIPLLMASFNPLIASIMTPALLYASTTLAQILAQLECSQKTCPSYTHNKPCRYAERLT